MKLYFLPNEVDDLLYDWQRHEILKKIKGPIAYVQAGDPGWDELDDLLTGHNNIMNLEALGVECSIHEILPGHNAAWISDASRGEGDWIPETIIIGETDLAVIRDQGIDGLALATLFRDF